MGDCEWGVYWIGYDRMGWDFYLFMIMTDAFDDLGGGGNETIYDQD